MTNLNHFTKPHWQTLPLGTKLCTLNLKSRDAGDICVEVSRIKKYNYETNDYETNLYTKTRELAGKEVFWLSPEKKEMVGCNIEIRRVFRGKHLGELLRLVSIIEMVENKVSQMQIFSRESAVYFHSKYGFEPNIKRFFERDNALESIATNPMFVDLAQKAKFLINRVKECTSNEGLRELCRMTSELTDEYLKRVRLSNLQKSNLHPFKYGFAMKLSMENILQEKDWFNILFEKHGIDYKI